MLISPQNKFLEEDGDRPSLGILYLASQLRKIGHDVQVSDMSHDTWYDFKSKLEKFDPDMVGVTSTTPTFNQAVRIADAVKEFNKKIVTAIGGAHVSANPDSSNTRRSFDKVVIGEGEKAVVDIASTIEKGNDFAGGHRFYRSTYIRDLDELDFPARDLINMDNYGLKIEKEPATTMITSRGCPFNCCFCNKHVFERAWRARSAENVVGEIKELADVYGIHNFYFLDDTFTIDKRRVEKICKLIKALPFDVQFRATTRADTVNERILRLMGEAGCDIVSYGVESGDDMVLKWAGKGMNTTKNEKAVEWAHNAGLKVKGFFIFGLPHENERSINRTINFAKSLQLEYADFYVLTPFPGTPFWEDPKKYGMEIEKPVNDDWESYYQAGKGDVPIHIKHENLTHDQLRHYLKLAREEVCPDGNPHK